MSLGIFAHIYLDQTLIGAEHFLSQHPSQLRLTHPGRAEKDKRADRSVRITNTGSGAPDCLSHCFNRLMLTNHPVAEPPLQVRQLDRLGSLELLQRDTGHLTHRASHVINLDSYEITLTLLLFQVTNQIFELAKTHLVESGMLIIFLSHSPFHIFG